MTEDRGLAGRHHSLFLYPASLFFFLQPRTRSLFSLLPTLDLRPRFVFNTLTCLPFRARSAVATRTMATESRAHLFTGMPSNMKELRSSIWLADPGAYPVIFTLGFALTFSASFIAYCALRNPDVRITTGRRQQLLRTWEH